MRQSEIERILQTAKGIIFDLDGTLIDSMFIWEEADAKYLKNIGLEPEKDLAKTLFAMSMEEATQYLKEHYKIEKPREKIAEEIVALVREEYFFHVKEKPGVKELLDSIGKQGIPMVLATSCDPYLARGCLERLDIWKYFGEIFTCSQIGKAKDEPDIYLQAAGHLGEKPEDIWVFEDAVHAAETAKKAGFLLAGVYDSYSEKSQEKLKEIADCYVRTYLCEKETRLNKYLSDAGVCSRRQADKLIEEGKVFVDGRPASMGTKVCEGQEVTVDGKKVKKEEEFILLAYHKPRGIECTANPQVESNVMRALDYPKKVFYVGRLDKDSEGLLLFTNQGELANEIAKAANYHEKEYEVMIQKNVDNDFVKKMSNGVRIRKVEKVRGEEKVIFDTVTRKCQVKRTGTKTFRIVITQGLNRQIRRMCETCGARVISLKRIRVMNILLGDLKPGEYREITGIEREELMQGLKSEV